MPWEFLAGVDGIKREVEDVVLLLLQHPDMYARVLKGTRGEESSLGANARPKAVLFEGPPGCGKTSMARMMAGRAGVPMVYLPLEAVGSRWYGEGEKLLAKVFELTGKVGGEKGALLFLDEIETLGLSRESEMHEASRRMLSVLLRSIDGVSSSDEIILIGATNRVGDMDRALRSRFDHSVRFALPDAAAREAILQGYTRHLSPRDRKAIARQTDKFSGRDLRDVCEQAERRCAARIIRGLDKDGALPAVEEYIEAAASRRNSGLQ